MLHDKKPIASIILPVYNEELIIGETFDKVSKYSKGHEYEFIFVNDGSSDNTKKIIEEKMKSAENKNIRLVSYPNNKGKGGAIKIGVENSNGKNICFLDSDLAYSLDHIPEMLKKLEISDMVIGRRGLVKKNIDHISSLRKIVGRVFNRLACLILGFKVDDTQAGLKGFKEDIAKEIFKRQTITNFSFDVELIFIAHKHNYVLSEIPARLSKEHTDKNSKVKIIRDSIKMFFSLIKIKLNDIRKKYE